MEGNDFSFKWFLLAIAVTIGYAVCSCYFFIDRLYNKFMDRFYP